MASWVAAFAAAIAAELMVAVSVPSVSVFGGSDFDGLVDESADSVACAGDEGGSTENREADAG